MVFVRDSVLVAVPPTATGTESLGRYVAVEHVALPISLHEPPETPDFLAFKIPFERLKECD